MKVFFKNLFFTVFQVDYRILEIYIVQCSRKYLSGHDCLKDSRLLINLIFEEDRRIKIQ